MELEQAVQLWGTEWQTLHRGTASAASSRILIKVLLSSSQQAEVGSPTVIHALRRTTAHEKVQYFDEGDDVRDRFDASTASLSNSMIRMPYKHHCLLLADLGEARERI